jgi:hypothetical protein
VDGHLPTCLPAYLHALSVGLAFCPSARIQTNVLSLLFPSRPRSVAETHMPSLHCASHHPSYRRACANLSRVVSRIGLISVCRPLASRSRAGLRANERRCSFCREALRGRFHVDSTWFDVTPSEAGRRRRRSSELDCLQRQSVRRPASGALQISRSSLPALRRSG